MSEDRRSEASGSLGEATESLDSEYHHKRCPVCQQRFLGFTDADMIKHFVEEHEDYGKVVARKLGMTEKKVETCDDCGREYVTFMGDCPWCRHDGPPYT